MQYQQQQQRGIQQCPHGQWAYNLGLQPDQLCSVAAWDDNWRIEMKRAFTVPRQLRVAVLVIFQLSLHGRSLIYSRHTALYKRVLIN